MTTGGFLLKIIILGSLLNACICDVCSPNPCQNYGQCSIDGGTEFKCSCERGWTGSLCENNLDNCITNMCQNGAKCIDQSDDRYLCKCKDQYIGNYCEFKNPCLNDTCQNGGICKPQQNGDIICHCSKYFKGDYCEKRTQSCPRNVSEKRSMCSGRGICENQVNGSLRCRCDSGYEGSYCNRRIKVKAVIRCQEGFCLNGGRCTINGAGNYVCSCIKGFSGYRCSIAVQNIKPTGNHLTTTSSVHQSLTSKNCSSECFAGRSNGICEQRCNVKPCQYDGGDCDPWKRCRGPLVAHCQSVFDNNQCDPECNTVECLFDGQDCDKFSCLNHRRCSKVYQNGICDQYCNSPQCGFDGGDCQSKNADSFFANIGSIEKCSTNIKEFELDLILTTSKENFRQRQKSFLQILSSSLKMVFVLSGIEETKVNVSSSLTIKLKIDPIECVVYGGQCFSSLEQISDFIRAGINRPGYLKLPFQIAKVESKTISTMKTDKIHSNMYQILFISIGLALILCLVVIAVLLRAKWKRLNNKVKSSGIWTPSGGYSTSTLSINSNHHFKVPITDNNNNYNTFGQCQYENNLFKNSQLEKEFDSIPGVINRKRRHDVANPNNGALKFQLLSEVLQNQDGVNCGNETFSKFLNLENKSNQIKSEELYTDLEDRSVDHTGEYVNDYGESLLHIAARMNADNDVIRSLYSTNPFLLQCSDKWGRTPLSVAVASDSFESIQELLSLEKESRKEFRQNRGRSIQSCAASFEFSDPVSAIKTTGLIEAVKMNNGQIIDLLLEEGSQLNVVDSMGRSVVHWAAMLNNVTLLDQLSRTRIFRKLVDLKDIEERTPLYLASNEGSMATVAFIVDYMIKCNLRIDPTLPSPTEVAQENEFQDIVCAIEKIPLIKCQREKIYKKRLLKNQSLMKKISEKKFKYLDIIEEWDNKSSADRDSLGSFQFNVESAVEDSLLTSFDDILSDVKGGHTLSNQRDVNIYLSNSSSSEMSPALLTSRNASIFNENSRLQSTLQTNMAFNLTENQQDQPSEHNEPAPIIHLYNQYPYNIKELTINCR